MQEEVGRHARREHKKECGLNVRVLAMCCAIVQHSVGSFSVLDSLGNTSLIFGNEIVVKEDI